MQYNQIMKWPVCLGFGGCQTADTRRQWTMAMAMSMSMSVHPSAASLIKTWDEGRVLGSCEQLFVPNAR